jgi:hypothetical protein
MASGRRDDETLPVPVLLLMLLVDDEDCWFDHHGGCQAHGYLGLEPGETCPQAQLKALLDAGGVS